MFSLLYNLITRSLIVLLVAMLSVNYLPDKLFGDFPFQPKSIEPNNFDSVKPQWNTKLSDGNPEFIQLNNILGPESITVAKNGLLYTGLADGRIVELNPNKNYQLRTVLKFKTSSYCKDNLATRADDCGRFLQLRMVNETLYALEANTGLYKIDVKSGTKTFVGPKSLYRVNLYNSFAFDPKDPNLVYLTITSTKWNLLTIMWSILEVDDTGKVLAFDLNSSKRVILLDNLYASNGIDVDKKRDKLLFAETFHARINSLDLDEVRSAFKSAKDGEKLAVLKRTSLIPITPGLPDNLIVEGDTAYIALPFVRINGKELVDHLATMPSIRMAIARASFGLGNLIQYFSDNIYHHPLLEFVYEELKSGHVIYRLTQTDKSAVLEYNLATGASKFYGSDKFGFVSEAKPYSDGHLLLGSFRSAFIVKVKV